MSWKVRQLLFRLDSPLHIGWRRVGNCWQCRSYLPAYPLLCALAARLTESGRRLGSGEPYTGTLAWLREHLRFTYFFPAIREDPAEPDLTVFLPVYGDGRLSFQWRKQTWGSGAVGYPGDTCSQTEFEYLFLDAQARTALSYPERASLEGALYHFDFLCPRTREHHRWGRQTVWLTGYVLMDDEACSNLLVCQENEAQDDQRVFHELFDRLQVGGERRLGWGLLCLDGAKEIDGDSLILFGQEGLTVDLKQRQPVVTIENRLPVLAHTIPPRDTLLKGPVEIVLRRETYVSDTGQCCTGARITRYGADEGARALYCPGSQVEEGLEERLEIVITAEGLWNPVGVDSET